MSLRRRDFITSVMVIGISSLFRKNLYAKTPNAKTQNFSKSKRLIFATTKKQKFYLNNLIVDEKINIINESKLEIPLAVHSLLRLSDNELLAIPKKANHLGKINVTTNTHKFFQYKDIQFYGHATIAVANPNFFYIVEKERNSFFVFKRSIETLDRVGEAVYSSQREIHMIEIFDDVLVMCIDDFDNPAVATINIKTKQIVEHKIPQKHFRPGHLLKTNSGAIITAGISGQKYEKGGVGVLDENSVGLVEKEKFLSIKPVFWFSQIKNSDLVCAVSPYSNRIVFLSGDRKKIIKEVTLNLPQGVVTYNTNYLVVFNEGVAIFDKEANLTKTIYHKTATDLLEDFHPILI